MNERPKHAVFHVAREGALLLSTSHGKTSSKRKPPSHKNCPWEWIWSQNRIAKKLSAETSLGLLTTRRDFRHTGIQSAAVSVGCTRPASETLTVSDKCRLAKILGKELKSLRIHSLQGRICANYDNT
jgi:hypothetical protein